MTELYGLRGKWVFDNKQLTQDVIAMELLIGFHDQNPKAYTFCVSDDSSHEIEKMKADTPRELLRKDEVKKIFSIFETSDRIQLGHSICWDEGYRWDCGAVWADENTDNIKNEIEKDLITWSNSKKVGKHHEDARHLSNMLILQNKLDIFLTVDYKTLLIHKDKILKKYNIKLMSPMELIYYFLSTLK